MSQRRKNGTEIFYMQKNLYDAKLNYFIKFYSIQELENMFNHKVNTFLVKPFSCQSYTKNLYLKIQENCTFKRYDMLSSLLSIICGIHIYYNFVETDGLYK